MEDIINKIVVNKRDIVFDRIELELNLKIEKEKTKQLELIKDIRKIEKSIKEKELYCKRKKTLYMDDYESDNSSDESDSDSDSDSDSNDNSSENIQNKTLISNEVEKNDTLSLCSIDSDYDIEKEIDIEFY
jgi:hypothetical protein